MYSVLTFLFPAHRSGKSTIARLLLRFYDPLEGSVCVDGMPLQKLNLEWWRRQVSHLFVEC